MDTVNICCINNKIYQTIEYTTIIDLNEKLKYIIDNNCELCIQLTLNNIVLNKFNIINNAVLSKLTDTDVIKIIFNQEDLLLDCTTNNLKILEAVKNNINVLLNISDDLKNDKEFILTCIKKNGLALEFASNNLKNDIEIVLYAVLQDELALEFASDELKNKIKIIEKLSIPSLQCPYCENFYKSSSTKSFHMKSCKLDHPEIIIVNNRNICNICNKKFVFVSSVYKHRKICLKKKERIILNNNTTNNNSNNINNKDITNNSANNSVNNSNNITNITQNFNFKDNN